MPFLVFCDLLRKGNSNLNAASHFYREIQPPHPSKDDEVMEQNYDCGRAAIKQQMVLPAALHASVLLDSIVYDTLVPPLGA